MTILPLPPLSFLRECFDYDSETGSLVWRRRPEHHFPRKGSSGTWNAQNPGKSGGRDSLGYQRFQTNYGGGQKLLGHRVAYALGHNDENVGEIDHINGDPSDNRLANLRLASRSQNNANRGSWAKVGLKGVTLLASGKFRASAHLGDKRTKYLGQFATAEEAHQAFCEFASARHGEFFSAGPNRPSVFD